MIIITFLEGNNHGQDYESILTLDASTKEEVEEILEVEENGEGHPKAVWDRSKEPDNYQGAGGFIADLVSAVDENGNDRVNWVSGWYGFPPGKECAFL